MLEGGGLVLYGFIGIYAHVPAAVAYWFIWGILHSRRAWILQISQKITIVKTLMPNHILG